MEQLVEVFSSGEYQTPRKIAHRFRHVYPGEKIWVVPVQPDLLGEHFVARFLDVQGALEGRGEGTWLAFEIRAGRLGRTAQTLANSSTTASTENRSATHSWRWVTPLRLSQTDMGPFSFCSRLMTQQSPTL